jgi:hypothetical protein
MPVPPKDIVFGLSVSLEVSLSCSAWSLGGLFVQYKIRQLYRFQAVIRLNTGSGCYSYGVYIGAHHESS